MASCGGGGVGATVNFKPQTSYFLTLIPKPRASDPKPQTSNPKPQTPYTLTLNPKPQTLNPQPPTPTQVG